MNLYCNIREIVSPQLIREISGVLDSLHSGEGFLLRDDQGIAILAEDKGEREMGYERRAALGGSEFFENFELSNVKRLA